MDIDQQFDEDWDPKIDTKYQRDNNLSLYYAIIAIIRSNNYFTTIHKELKVLFFFL
jgi:hypothetical protein